MSDIRETIRRYLDDGISANTMRTFAGMIETGEATTTDFAHEGVHLNELCNYYGPPNCWTGTNGSAAAALRNAIKAQS